MFFFFNDTAPTEIYTLSLHDALPICPRPHGRARDGGRQADGLGVLEVGVDGGDDDARLDRDQVDADERDADPRVDEDRKSTRLNSSHANISYAVFCLKKKKPSLPPGS